MLKLGADEFADLIDEVYKEGEIKEVYDLRNVIERFLELINITIQ